LLLILILAGVLSHITESTRLYIHSIAIRSYEQNYRAGKIDNLINNAAHFEALRICLEASHTTINQYLSFSVEDARCLPHLYLLWTVYATVMLIKLSHFNETMYSMLQGQDRSTTDILESLLAKLDELSVDGYWPQAKEFRVLFERLRAWFLYKKGSCQFGDPDCNIVGAHSSETSVPGVIENGRSQITPTATINHGVIDHQNPQSNVHFNSLALGTTNDLATYENMNWDGLGFDADYMNTFDLNMQDERWMNYLYGQQPVMGDERLHGSGA
jgi:hypothetical protein